MNMTFLIGNGFDIRLGLKTKFKVDESVVTPELLKRGLLVDSEEVLDFKLLKESTTEHGQEFHHN